MTLKIELTEHAYNNILAIDSINLGRVPYKGIIMSAINAIKRGEMQEPKAEWIPVSERLPEDGTWNIFTDGKKISIERYKTDALDHFYPSGRWFSLDEAVAWQPLPKPYSEVEQ